MEKSENRLVQIYEALREEGRVHTKRDFAALLEVDYANLISAMNGAPRSYTPRMIERAEKVLNNEAAPAPPRNVEELSPAEMLRIIGGQADTIRSQQEVIARLLGAETKKGAV